MAMTEADEQKAINFEVHKFNERLQKLNKQHKYIQVTGLKLQINHPSVVRAEPWFIRMFRKKKD